MKLTEKQIKILKDLMIEPRKKGNIATAVIVLDSDIFLRNSIFYF